jgi:hypothetical protein
VISATLDNTAQDKLQRYENNYKVLNLITTTLCRNAYDRVVDLVKDQRRRSEGVNRS